MNKNIKKIMTILQTSIEFSNNTCTKLCYHMIEGGGLKYYDMINEQPSDQAPALQQVAVQW